MAAILFYSSFTAACGFVRSALELGIFRALLGLGMGGEWATGAALVSKSFPAKHRGKALAFVQSTWASGYGLAALVNPIVLPLWGWRGVFFVGVLPALVTFWIRHHHDLSHAHECGDLLPIYGSLHSPPLLLALGPIVSYFGGGFYSGFGAVIVELCPTAVRAAAAGICYNTGRIASAAVPFAIGSLASTRGFGTAFAVAGVLVPGGGGLLDVDPRDGKRRARLSSGRFSVSCSPR